MYLLKKAPDGTPKDKKVTLLGSGSILREVEAGADLLKQDYGIEADIWSVTSFTELRRDALDCERWSMLHPEEPRRISYVERCLGNA
ncbi:hypothetical protein J8J40_27675, partial [Mycobacterium tuberculosis]|nr:hypothetical protein [Mycobacterium tuberculosis]